MTSQEQISHFTPLEMAMFIYNVYDYSYNKGKGNEDIKLHDILEFALSNSVQAEMLFLNKIDIEENELNDIKCIYKYLISKVDK